MSFVMWQKIAFVSLMGYVARGGKGMGGIVMRIGSRAAGTTMIGANQLRKCVNFRRSFLPRAEFGIF